MSLKSILPVLDLKGGIVVRGVAGQRASYQAIRSQIASDPSPASVARGLVSAFGFQDAYVADLDAIAGEQPNWHAYEAIAKSGLNLIIDAGITDEVRAALCSDYASEHPCLQGIVVGLESIPEPQKLQQTAGI